MAVDPKIVVNLLADRIGISNDRLPTREETKLATRLEFILRNASNVCFIDDDESIDLDEDAGEYINDYPNTDEDDDWAPEEEFEDTEEKHGHWTINGHNVTSQDVKDAWDYYTFGDPDSRKRRIHSSVHALYRFIDPNPDTNSNNSLGQLRKCMKLIEETTQTHDRLMAEIDRRVFQKIVDARSNSYRVRDRDIRTFALDAYRELDEKKWKFKASDSWVLAFKKRHDLVSRKGTHIVTRITAGQEGQIREKAQQFVNVVARRIPDFDPTHVINADQMGFPLEMSNGRTITFKGETKVRLFAQRMSAVTHSCTVLPVITLAGTLAPTLFMQLQEPNGQFPQNWACQRPNVFAAAGRSYIMTKDTMNLFLRHCVRPIINNNVLLLVDSWSAFKDHDTMRAQLPRETHRITIGNIPPKCTPICQPLDVFFNRMWKCFARNITEHAILHSTTDILSQRDNVIKLHSLIHEQFSAPRFQRFIQFAWHASGYTPNHPGEFDQPNDYCFEIEPTATCATRNCAQSVLLKCAICTHYFCFTCFFTNCHSHL